MRSRNNRTNTLILWAVIAGDFVLLNIVLLCISMEFMKVEDWNWENKRLFLFICNVSLLVSEVYFHTIIHQRLVSAGDILRRLVYLTLTQVVIAYIFMRHIMYWTGSGWLLVVIGVLFFFVLVVARLLERNALKHFRSNGRNSRTVTLVGSDSELSRLYEQLLKNPTTGYRVQGYYADENQKNMGIPWLGTIKSMVDDVKRGKDVKFGDELYVCLSRHDRDTIKLLSQHCDSQVTRFFYVPVSVETISLNLTREYVNDIEVFTTHESPLQVLPNRIVKRLFDIVVSVIGLALTGLLFPFVFVMIKLQSPGPVFFCQHRTGLDGKNFMCYKFRSMHVNKNADLIQAKRNDPRKFPFGNFMRKMNIDELPQFWNVLRGDMSVVGPRPHMLSHTDTYSRQIGEYMVRLFVRPGITGYAQVTGYRGETKELWQMEERVRRDIWYIEHWSIWLDIRIIWMTFKTFFVHDKNAY